MVDISVWLQAPNSRFRMTEKKKRFRMTETRLKRQFRGKFLP